MTTLLQIPAYLYANRIVRVLQATQLKHEVVYLSLIFQVFRNDHTRSRRETDEQIVCVLRYDTAAIFVYIQTAVGVVGPTEGALVAPNCAELGSLDALGGLMRMDAFW